MESGVTKYNRLIMSYDMGKPGPLLIVLAGIHGNEPAGIEALKLVKKMLEVEPITNPDFCFGGKIIGLLGNQAARAANVRFIDQDLNRIWKDEVVAYISSTEDNILSSEEQELAALLKIIRSYIASGKYQKLYILDLHTTSSGGGIFAIPTDDKESIEIASNLFTPVILNMLSGIEGTTLHFFKRDVFPDIDTVALTFEGGRHDDPLSINRCIAAIINCLRSIACVSGDDVENIHDQVLKEYSKELPKKTRLLYKHHITPEDQFVMYPGFSNFDDIEEGQELASDISGTVHSPYTGKILMPLYQSKGEEGFYIIEEI